MPCNECLIDLGVLLVTFECVHKHIHTKSLHVASVAIAEIFPVWLPMQVALMPLSLVSTQSLLISWKPQKSSWLPTPCVKSWGTGWSVGGMLMSIGVNNHCPLLPPTLCKKLPHTYSCVQKKLSELDQVLILDMHTCMAPTVTTKGSNSEKYCL